MNRVRLRLHDLAHDEGTQIAFALQAVLLLVAGDSFLRLTLALTAGAAVDLMAERWP